MQGNRLTNYVKSSIEELRKVTWPTKNQAVKLTIIVLVFCAIFMVVLGVTDFILTELYRLLLNSSM
jgi:preprotein translocase subunit SecE